MPSQVVQRKTNFNSIASDEEPIYDQVASDEDYSSIDNLSIKSAGMKDSSLAQPPAVSIHTLLSFIIPPPQKKKKIICWKNVEIFLFGVDQTFSDIIRDLYNSFFLHNFKNYTINANQCFFPWRHYCIFYERSFYALLLLLTFDQYWGTCNCIFIFGGGLVKYISFLLTLYSGFILEPR